MYILFVEDDPRDAEVARTAMAGAMPEVRFDTAPDIPHAIAYLLGAGPDAGRLAENPAAIFLDLHLGDSRAIEFVEDIRGHARLAYVPIVMMADTTDPEEVQECYRNGVNAFVAKSGPGDDFGGRFVRCVRFWARINQVPPPAAPKQIP